jgi:hypothetical protein
LVGALAPLFQWILHKKFGIDFLKYVNFPIVFASTIFLPPATPLKYVPGVLVCFIFNYVIRRRHTGWWSKYNCKFSTSLLLFYNKPIGWILFLTRDANHAMTSVLIGLLDVLSSGLDSAYQFGNLIIFFGLQYPKNGNIGRNSIQTWWGNTVYTKTDDYVGVPYKSVPEGGKFGPSSW